MAALVGAAVVLIVSAAAHAGGLGPRRLVEVADLASPVISPDGAHVAFRYERASVERNAYDCFWYVQRVDGSLPPVRIADCGTLLRDSAGEPLAASVTWTPDGRWIYYTAHVDGRLDVWRAAADGSGAEAVTSDDADVRGFVLSGDGELLTYGVGPTREQVRQAEELEYDKGIRIDASIPVGQGLFRSGAAGGRLATQRLGEWFDRVPLLAETPTRWRSVELATGAVHDLAPSEAPALSEKQVVLPREQPSPWKMAREPDGNRIALLTRVGGADGLLEAPEVQLSVWVDDRTQPLECRATLCTNQAITGVQWRPGSDEVLFTVTDPRLGLAQTIRAWDVASGQVREIIRSDGLVAGGRARSSPCGISRDALVCVAAQAIRPPRLISVDLTTGAAAELFDPNDALARDLGDGISVRLMRWHDEHGREFTGQLYFARDKGEDAAPLFITYYLCPGFVRGGVGDEWPLISLAARGITALCINAAPYRIDAVERYDDGLAAVRSAVELLASDGQIDRRRVGMGGLSFGAETTFWVLMRSDLLAVASVGSPAISRQYYLLGSLRGEAFLAGLQRFWQAGGPEETPEQWRRLSPDLNLGTLRAPVLMQLPEQEYIHSLDYAIPMLREGIADLYVFPNEPHQKFQPRHKLAAYERNLDWFLFWLLGHEEDDPRKAGQYRQWRSMRSNQPGIEGRPSVLMSDPVLRPAQVEDAGERPVARR
ncbi:Atxe2 family lasso peptide isopeptidase [Luteimonas sp. YGD11-2]|uniref:Atxe2 family lasso peptide isopeptidase n=1 Tax=Luteimonas sp. YGD11-2 TaxID=2508168 RepID=UPI0013E922D2|nr:Atxe2 family lasso peptide isopeptidase [Luteimonas sp. YGD11-2]